MKKFNFIKIFMISTILIGALAASSFAASSLVTSIGHGWTTDGSDWFYVDNDGNFATETIKPSGDERYYLDVNGFMVRDYLLEDYNGGTYYFDDTGKMVKNTWVAVDPMQVPTGMDNPPTIYLYYFGANGRAFKASSGIVRKSIDGKKYMFNENGQMLSGWIDEQGERYNELDSTEDPFVGYCYYAGDETDGVLREGWSAYEDGSVDDKYYRRETLWFYFRSDNNKKVQSDNSVELAKRNINGFTYGFDINGVMIQGWDSDMMDDMDVTNKYFDEKGDNVGRLNKKEWIFAVPSKVQNSTDHDEEISQWFYANGAGDVIKGEMHRINKNFYAFNDKGIMKKGLCIVDSNTREYVDCIDLERTDGADFIVSRHYISYDKHQEADGSATAVKEYSYFDNEKNSIYYFVDDEQDPNYGMRKLNAPKVSFADADYAFGSSAIGEREGLYKKKYYQSGIELKADAGLGLGLVFLGYASTSAAASVDIEPKSYYDTPNNHAHLDKYHMGANSAFASDIYTDYVVDNGYRHCKNNGVYPVFAVVDATGKRISASNVVKKDKSGNYWMIGANATFVKAFNVPIKYVKSTGTWHFKSDKAINGGKAKNKWIPFGDSVASMSNAEMDEYFNTCWGDRDIWSDGHDMNDTNAYNARTTYEVPLDDLFATNFRFVEHEGSEK